MAKKCLCDVPIDYYSSVKRFLIQSTEDAGSSDEEGAWEPEPFIEEESEPEPEEVVTTQAKKVRLDKYFDPPSDFLTSVTKYIFFIKIRFYLI